MYFMNSLRNAARRMLQTYATKGVKRILWNTEFSGVRWACLDNTSGDCVYHYIQKYANQGSILDLGCGSGNTGVELDSSAYQDYTGVDISDVAIRRAKAKTEEHGRKGKNQYVQDEILSYVPSQQFDVILLRDSIYYLPTSKVKAMLSRYGRYLKENGVFIVRLWSVRGRYRVIEELIRKDFRVIDRTVSDRVDGVVMVFQTENSSYTL